MKNRIVRITAVLLFCIVQFAQGQNGVVDIDGNKYPSVYIGSQEWMAADLRSTRYSNGDSIKNGQNINTWFEAASTQTGAYCIYENDTAYARQRGKIYNGFTLYDNRNVCPSGWRVPTDNDFIILEKFIGVPINELNLSAIRGSDQKVGVKLKSKGILQLNTGLWDLSSATPGTDIFGWNGYPHGARLAGGDFCCGNGSVGYLVKDSTNTGVMRRELSFNIDGIIRIGEPMPNGHQIRCIKNSCTEKPNPPSYIPQNGLVGWWPFNGNANDESGNGNNGTVNGATLTPDRFGNVNKAYSFDGVNDFILTQKTNISGSKSRSYSIWFYSTGSSASQILTDEGGTLCGSGFAILINPNNQLRFDNTCSPIDFNNKLNLSSWHHAVIIYDSTISTGLKGIKCYIDGIPINDAIITGTFLINSSNTVPLTFGKSRLSQDQYFNGIIDDIGIWNRALTEQEIKNIYNGNICYQNVTVTDTLLINTTITGFNPISYQNTIKVFPNPSKDQITVDFGNFNTLNGYQLKITNSIGQQMYQTAINKQSVNISLGSWTGKGLYIIQIIDQQGAITDSRKIMIQ